MVASVGKNIRALRQARGITQEAFAEQLHVTRQAVSNWETGRTEPDLDTIQAIAAALRAEFTEVVYGPGHVMNAVPEAYRRFQKKKVIVFAILAALLVIGLILRVTLVRALNLDRVRTYDVRAYYIASTSVRSVICFSLTALIPVGIALVADIHIQNERLRRAVLGAGILLLAGHVLICMEPFMSAAIMDAGGPLIWPFHTAQWAKFSRNICAQYTPLAYASGALLSLSWNKK